MPSLRKTSFGQMARHTFPAHLRGLCEVMHFAAPGKPHTHGYVEHALCISGSGAVFVAGEPIAVSVGARVSVPVGVAHYMAPDKGVTLVMVILYEATGR